MNNHGVGAKQIGRHIIIIDTDTVIPNPPRQVQTAGGKPSAKQPAAALSPPVEAPPAPARHATHAAGPDCTLVRQVMITSMSKNEADSFDIFLIIM